jgi:hypothetical protein
VLLCVYARVIIYTCALILPFTVTRSPLALLAKEPDHVIFFQPTEEGGQNMKLTPSVKLLHKRRRNYKLRIANLKIGTRE